MAETKVIFSTKAKGQVIFTGNTIGLAGFGDNTEGFLNFTTANLDPPNGGTTKDWTQNSSSAKLDLPTGATVLHAELMWSMCVGLPENLDLRSNANDPVNFIDPKGALTPVTGRTDTARDYVYNNVEYFAVRTATVTDLVAAGENGFYTVGHIPCVLSNPSGNIVQEDTLGFWVLFVAYQLDEEHFRNLNIYYFGGGNVPGRVLLNNIKTPSTLPIDGHLLLAVGNGNSTRDGDSVWFGPTESTLTQLSTPNNLPNNFFSSQINDRYGYLDKTGTLGEHNVIPGQHPKVNDRNYCDLTGIDVSQQMIVNQTSAILDIRSIATDGLSILGGALQTREQEFPINPDKAVTPTQIDPKVGASVVYTINYYIPIETAYASAATIIIEDIVPSELLVISSDLNLQNSTLYTITDMSNGNNIKYKIVSSIPYGQFLPPTFKLTINATYAAVLDESCPLVKPVISNMATIKIDGKPPLLSNTAYIHVKPAQSIIDILESVALEGNALADLIDTEGRKIQTFIRIKGLSAEQAITLNNSVVETLSSISLLESILQDKIKYFDDFCGW